MSLHHIYKWTDLGKSSKRELRLPLLEWDILSAIDGQQSLLEISHQIKVEATETQATVEQLLFHNLIEEKRLSFDEYQLRGKQSPATMETSTPAYSLDLPPVPSSTPIRSLSVSAVINFIIHQAPSDREGQIAVYRVFLRIPPELLKKNQISSLSMVNDQTTVEDLELQDALTNAVAETLQLSLPESVFV